MTKGETLKLAVDDSVASSVEFRFGGPATHSQAATKSGTTFSISVSTLTWAVGFYAWQAISSSTTFSV